jgi:hypothetical protein
MTDGTSPRRERLTLADATILVAAAAIGFGVFRHVVAILGWPLSWLFLVSTPPGGWTLRIVIERALMAQVPTVPVAAAWTFALPVLQLRRGIAWRRLVRRPGLVACLAAIAGWTWASACAGLMFLADLATARFPRLMPAAWVNYYFDRMFIPIGLTVAAAWTFQALAGRWRPAPGWSDGIGVALGIYWIAAGVQYDCYQYVQLL